ncbi:MAG: hypothetical protein AAGC93_24170 [Cyanobacteria bacterium P01_F01_bin.53]
MLGILSGSPRRIKLPFLLDLVIVSDPAQIEQVEHSRDIDRLHTYPTQSLPWWVKLYFRATKFYDASRDLWFCPFESTSNPTYRTRRTYLEEKTAIGYRPEDVQRIAQMLRTEVSDDSLAQEMVQIVNHRFFKQEIPANISETAKHTVQKFSEVVIPWKYSKGVKAQKHLMNYCDRTLPANVHSLDVGHNIGEVMQSTAGALKILKDNLDKPIEEIFTTHAPTEQVPRIAVKASTLDGLLSSPTTPGKTVVILKLAKAAAQTKDIRFTFGAFQTDRACVFQDFFLSFMADLQSTLKAEP